MRTSEIINKMEKINIGGCEVINGKMVRQTEKDVYEVETFGGFYLSWVEALEIIVEG